MKHVGTNKIETERLILRKLQKFDAKDMFENYASRDVVTEFLPWFTHKTINDTNEYLDNVVLPDYEKEDTYRWAIVWKETGAVIGCIDVVEKWDKRFCAELGWVLSDDYWGRGIMPEAGREVLKILFGVGYRRIQARHDARNAKSGRVMQKIGMLHEGTFRKSRLDRDVEGQLNDVDMWAIVK